MPNALPRVGAKAPDFTLRTDEGEPLTLSALRGAPVVLYFYPKDDTETCTAEACSFRDAFPAFQNLGARVLGVSPDSVASHAKFKRKYALPFTLLADEDHRVAKKYRVWQEKTTFGHTYMGVVRTTFLIDAEGRIAHVFDKIRGAAKHADDVAKVLASLGQVNG